MEPVKGLGGAKDRFTSIFKLDDKRIRALRHILETEQKRKISYAEADEVAHELISLYECLAGDRRIVNYRQGDNDERQK